MFTIECVSINDPPVVVLANTHFNASECVSGSDCSGQPHAHHQPLLLFSSVSPGFADDEPGRGGAGGATVTGDVYSDAILEHVAHGDLGGIISTAADQAKTDPAGIQAAQRLDDKLSKYDWTGVGHASTQGYVGAAQIAQGVFGRA